MKLGIFFLLIGIMALTLLFTEDGYIWGGLLALLTWSIWFIYLGIKRIKSARSS